jgi:hypothetical protein
LFRKSKRVKSFRLGKRFPARQRETAAVGKCVHGASETWWCCEELSHTHGNEQQRGDSERANVRRFAKLPTIPPIQDLLPRAASLRVTQAPDRINELRRLAPCGHLRSETAYFTHAKVIRQ